MAKAMRVSVFGTVLFWTAMCVSRVHADIEKAKDVQVSPNGEIVAYQHEFVRTSLPIGGAAVIGRDISIRWAEGPEFKKWRSFRINRKKSGAGRARQFVSAEYAFSPDSQRIAVVGSHGIELIDLMAGSGKLVVDGKGVGVPCWRSKDEIAYATSEPTKSERPGLAQHQFWRLSIRTPDSKPRPTASVEVSETLGPCDHYWSPSGRYVVVGPSLDHGWLFVDTEGELRVRFGNGGDSFTASVSWHRQDRGAVCIWEDWASGRFEGFVVTAETGEIQDITDKLGLKQANAIA